MNRQTHELTNIQSQIYLQIPKGRHNAIKRTELAGLLGMKDVEMREEINECTKKGYTICSLGRGYFIPETAEDIRACIKYRDSYRKALMRQNYYLKKAEKEMRDNEQSKQ